MSWPVYVNSFLSCPRRKLAMACGKHCGPMQDRLTIFVLREEWKGDLGKGTVWEGRDHYAGRGRCMWRNQRNYGWLYMAWVSYRSPLKSGRLDCWCSSGKSLESRSWYGRTMPWKRWLSRWVIQREKRQRKESLTASNIRPWDGGHRSST